MQLSAGPFRHHAITMAALLMKLPARGSVTPTESSDVSALPDLTGDDRLDESFARGDDGSLRDVYDRYGSLVYTFCRRTLPTDAAADAAQETFVAAWRSQARYDRQRGSVGGWLMGIARYKVIEVLRREGRAPEPADLTQEQLTQAGPTSLEVEGLADRLLLSDALDQLPSRAREVVELAYFHDLTHGEIAERCDLPLGTVKSDLRRGVARLRRHLTTGRREHHG